LLLAAFHSSRIKSLQTMKPLAVELLSANSAGSDCTASEPVNAADFALGSTSYRKQLKKPLSSVGGRGSQHAVLAASTHATAAKE
jgi:hypothetical protein